ncbi:MAG: 30S ribosomal protein S11 [Candidatus Pacebacteria bacterium]|nr:30S ribosomal protein S11 [Candidatus Paceibacterota bacterium]MBP9851365.1 30S ribosomal protein S11 [Candidatus Paceibacterota bacterium]
MPNTKVNEKEEEKVVEGAEATETKVTKGKAGKRKITAGILSVEATFNNTKVTFSDKSGNTLFWSSSGSLGFKGAKKGTPFAASKVGDIIGDKAQTLGVKEADVVIKGVGSGREPAVRAFMAHGVELTSIKDVTPVPHNGPKPKKPRRV